MCTITILANDIIYDNLYHVNIFQSTHIAAYGQTHMHTPPKVFIQSWINFTQWVDSKTRGYVNKEIDIQNIKLPPILLYNKKYNKDIHYKDYEIHT